MLRSLKSAIDKLISEYDKFFSITKNNLLFVKSSMFSSTLDEEICSTMIKNGNYVGVKDGIIVGVFAKNDKDEYIVLYTNGRKTDGSYKNITQVLDDVRKDLFSDEYLFMFIEKKTGDIHDAIISTNSADARKKTGLYSGYIAREISPKNIDKSIKDLESARDKYISKANHIDDLLNKIRNR